METTADKIKFRCSSLGHLMTEARSKSETLSESTKTHLIDVFISAKYKRREEITSKFLDKGNEREEDGITLLSRINKTFYKKNAERLENDFVSGECDIFLGDKITEATETFDTKLSWSTHTFFRAQKDELNKMYYWQGVGYMWLTGANKHTVAYCLVNGTEKAISDEKRRLAYSMGLIDTATNPEYKEKAKQIEINHIFDIQSFYNEYPHFDFDNDIIVDNTTVTWGFDIPKEERLFTFTFDRNEAEIDRLKNRIIEARCWMDINLFKTQLQTA